MKAMFKTPRFVITESVSQIQTLGSALNYNASFEFDTYIYVDSTPSSNLLDLMSKICKSVKRESFKVIEQDSNMSHEQADHPMAVLDNIANESLNLSDFRAWLQSYKTNFKNKPNLILLYSNKNRSTQVSLRANLENPWVEIQTYDLQTINDNPNSKAEFWSYLKELV